MRNRQDEIIQLQTDLIRKMTANNLKRMADDFFGQTDAGELDLDKIAREVQERTDAISGGAMPGFVDAEPKKATPDSMDKNPLAETKTESADISEKEETEETPESIEDLKKELEEYIGLTNIKREVNDLVNLMTVYQMRKENDLPVADVSLHMVFTGNPGTGKTMIARLMARFYKALGILKGGQLVEVDRSMLVAGYVGQTATKTMEALEKAKGGVLFIDEAYTLSRSGDNDFGQEAIDTVLKYMEDHRDEIVVIVAGYDDLMNDFIHSNPGLESRFNRYMHFEDYTAEELMAIFEQRCKKNCYQLTEDAKESVYKYLDQVAVHNPTFGNARGARNLFEKVLVQQANRLAVAETITRESLMEVTQKDVWVALEGEDGILQQESEAASTEE